MAYREFYKPIEYAVEDSSYLNEGISNIFKAIGEKEAERRKASDQFKYDLDKGAFENDQKILTEYAHNVVNSGRDEILKTGRQSNETNRRMAEGAGYQQQSKLQYEEAKALSGDIDKMDAYTNKEVLQNALREATHGKDNDVNFYTRGERLAEFRNNIGNLKGAFNADLYRADYVKRKGTEKKDIENSTPSIANKSSYQATFWDKEKGSPGVTDDHAIDYINSDPRVNQFYDQKMNDTLDAEITSMKASGDPRVAWMKGQSDAQIKDQLIRDSSKNIINQEQYGIRKRNLAKRDLTEADNINSAVSHEKKAPKETTNNGLYKNENLGHSFNFITNSAQANDGGGIKPHTTSGPGGVLLQKNGKPIQFNSSNSVRTNINTGLTTRHTIGSYPFQMTSFQLNAFQNTGGNYAIPGNNTDELIANINKIPFSDFNPNGKVKLKPTMSIGLNGYTVNRTDILDATNNQRLDLQSKIHAAEKAGNTDEAERLTKLDADLKAMQGIINNSDVSDSELLLAATRFGVKGIQQNLLIEATDQDLGNIKSLTQGFDLNDRRYWSPEMVRVYNAYQQRYQQAAANGFVDQKSTKKKPTAKPKVVAEKTSSQEDFNTKWKALAPGQSLIGPDGIEYTKKKT